MPLVIAVRGATVTKPKEPTMVWTISAATYTLNAEWKNWGEKNDALAADDCGLVLSNVMINGSHLEDTASAKGISASFEQRLKNDRDRKSVV